MKLFKLLTIFGILVLTLASVSAYIADGQWENGRQSITINSGDIVNFDAYSGTTMGSMHISVRLYGVSTDELIKTFFDDNVEANTFSRTYTLNTSSINDDEDYVLEITGSDKLNSDTYTLSLTVLPQPNNAPTITSTPNPSVAEDQAYNYQVTSTDADNDPLTYSLTQSPAWLSIDSDTGLITGTAPSVNSDTDYSIEVRVFDGADDDTQSFTLTVTDTTVPVEDTIAPVITITNPVEGGIYNTGVINKDHMISDDSGSVETCWYSTDSGVTNSTPEDCATFTQSLSPVEGTNEWTLYARDLAGNVGSATVTFYVDTIAPIVNILYPDDLETYTEYVTQFNYAVSDSGLGLDECWYSSDGGETNTTVTCGQTITNVESVEGTNEWTLYARDLAGNVASASVLFEVNLNLDDEDDDDEKDKDGYSFRDIVSTGDYESQFETIRVAQPEITLEEDEKSIFTKIWEAIINFLRELFNL